MRRAIARIAAAAIVLMSGALFAQTVADDQAVRAAVARFFAAQEAEDAAAYLALWSSRAEKPRPDQLAYIFSAGDDRFRDIQITRMTPIGDLVRVVVTVTRERTDARAKRPDGTPRVSTMRREWSLTFAREAEGLKILSEGVPADDLANALIAAATEAEREQLLDAESHQIHNRLITSLSQRGANLAQQSRFRLAAHVYEITLDIARRVGNRKAEGEALQNLGNAKYYLRDLAGALAAYEARRLVEGAAGNDAGVASALLGMATIRYSHFEYAAALGHYSEALAIFEKLGDGMSVATTLVSTGNVYYLQGDYESAIRDYRRSRDLNRALLHPAGEARALEGLGRTLTAQGDYAGALEAFAGVAEDARARADAAMQGNASQSLGEAHFRLGNLDAARGAFDESRRHFERITDVRAAGRVWQGIGLTELVAGRFGAAEQAYNTSIAACTAGQDGECVVRALVGLAFAHHSQEHYDEAIAFYRKAIAAFIEQQALTEAARAEIGLSQSLYGKKEFAAAIAAAAHARELSGVPDVQWRALLAEARSHRQRKDGVKAMASARAAVSVVQSMAAAALRLPSERVPADSGDAYGFLAVLYADASDSVSAFTALEQRRAHALRVALANNDRDIAAGMTPDERDAERAAAAAVISLQVQIDRERELPAPDTKRLTALDARLTEATAARTLQQQQLFTRLPDLRIWRGMAPAANADDLAPLLRSHDIVLAEFLIDNDDLLAVVVVPDGEDVRVSAQAVSIERRDLAELIAETIAPATLVDVTAWRTASSALVKALPPRAFEALGAARRAVVIPDDVLWRVPFEALPMGDGYLADRTEVVYAGSVTALVRPPRIQARTAGALPPPLLAIGAPALPQPLVDRIKATAPGWTLRAGDGPEREVRLAASAVESAPASILVGADATEAAFRTAAPAAAALHVALPFRLNSASPLFSPILSSANSEQAASETTGATNDGVLEAREVMNLDLTARVAVLSDGAALSMRDAAAATATLQWAWRAAGVPALVLPRWSTDDRSAAALLADFHSRVAAGDAPETALQAARQAVRGREATRAPWFWAQWMVVGPTLKPEHPKP